MAVEGQRTHYGGMTVRVGQIGHSPGRRATSSVAVLAAGSLLAAVGLAACGTDVAKADTVLRAVRATTVQLADGSTRPADDGMTVPKGATVTTAPGGSASLVTAGRVVLLGSDTAVAVLDGRREQLRRGLVMIDAREAGDLELDAGAGTVTAKRGAITRVERDALLRVASFRRGVTVRAAGRRATVGVPELRQVQVPYGGLPGRVTALGLTRDSWERRYALDLVTTDVDLTGLADGLDRNAETNSAVSRALPATFRDDAGLADGERRSDRTLGYLLAGAARRGGDAEQRYGQVRRLRAEGGSWGVVAAIVDADVPAVSAALDELLAPSEPVLAVEPGTGPIDVGSVFGEPGQPTTTTTTPDGPGGSPAPGPTSGPRPTSKPSPSPSGSPDPVEEVVTTIASLLPTPPPSAPPGLPLPLPSPLAQVEVGGLTVNLG